MHPNPSFGWVVVAAAGWGGAWRVWAGLGLVWALPSSPKLQRSVGRLLPRQWCKRIATNAKRYAVHCSVAHWEAVTLCDGVSV